MSPPKSAQFEHLSVLAALEASVRRRLLEYLNPLSISVDEFPADPLDLDKPPVKTRVLVAFAGQSHVLIAEPDSWNRTRAIERTVQFDINYDFASLRSHAGVYLILDVVNEAMQGWIPKIAPIDGIEIQMRPCMVLEDSFRSLVDGATYLYSTRLRFSFTSVVTRQLTDPVQLKQIGIAIHRSQVGDLDTSIKDIELTLNRLGE